ncbi:RHS repeat-associated core domain-containing protein [Phytopseudomonas daroniae]|uniref:RHS repeat-associated core domain-containing protein n=1 Tax=Phytopseudomonas daroniae TaxID=2487519 RepID=UPI00103832E9|nr:RHS repeat-associated core domain-containing protein [Pseudomonas daroniae]TBU74089.1 hypothetical protein DNK10_15730 [Pseudomonas daroniae]
MRVLQEQGGVRKVSFYGQAGLLLEEDLATNKRKEYIYAGGELIAHGGSDGTLYYHNDHLGSPVAASNAQGALQWRTHFRPYGERQAEGGANVGSIGYTGHMQDDGSGLVYAGARYYDPVVGRFLAIDPVGVDAGRPVSFNRYAYANNSPYGFVDPDGRSPVVAMEIAVAGAQILTGTAIVNSTGGMTAFPAHQGGGEVYGGSSIDPTMSGPWHTGRPASGFDLLTWMLTVKSSGPRPNGGNAKPHGNSNHNDAIDSRIDGLRQDPSVSNIRKNQQQVDVDGGKIGTNRADIQYDKGCHYCVEYDHVPKNSVRHGDRIRANDPGAKTELNLL